MRNFLVLSFLLIVVFSGIFVFGYFLVQPVANAPVACTMEAKLCPDGTYVGRTGPKCEFAECPVLNSGITGVAMLGPFCPVERIPPGQNCADRPYQTSLVAASAVNPQLAVPFESGADGKFSVTLAPGDYMITSANTAGLFSHCSSQGVITVLKNKYTDITLNCDTGIR